MTKTRLPLILIYGNSPQLIRVERTLRADPDVRVIHIDPDGPSAADQVAVLREGVLLYDPATTDPALIQALRTLHPEMGVVGVGETAGADAFINPENGADEIAAALHALGRGFVRGAQSWQADTQASTSG